VSARPYSFDVGAQAPCFEFTTHAAPEPLGDALPVQPGQVLRGGGGRPVLLHFAPRRWLVPAPDAALAARLNELAARGLGALVDVEGKWRSVRAEGPAAAQAIASTISVDAILRDRECAAVSLFDSPTILARRGGAFDLWVAASYLDHFIEVTRTLRLPS
jgi:heterotetrameric sarcosine oxidase gamma subunit